jgi:hypothetical protein
MERELRELASFAEHRANGEVAATSDREEVSADV